MSMLALARCLDGRCRMMTVAGGAASQGQGRVVISASVGENAANRLGDVRVIQDALNQVPAGEGGPAVPLKVDGLCYGKTLAAIRRFQKEACNFKWPDGRIEPERKTHIRLREFFRPPYADTMPRVYLVLSRAVLWINSAKRVIGDAELHLRGLPGFTKRWDAVNRYYHLDKLSKPQAAASLARLRSTFIAMETCIGHSSPLTTLGSGYFQEDPYEAHASAYTFSGGFTRRSRTRTTPPMSKDDNYKGENQRQDTIFVCSRILNVHSDNSYADIVVHELAHFCGPEPGPDEISDHAYRKRALPPEQDKFFKLTPYLAIRTADCYSEFAGYAHFGHETRPG